MSNPDDIRLLEPFCRTPMGVGIARGLGLAEPGDIYTDAEVEALLSYARSNGFWCNQVRQEVFLSKLPVEQSDGVVTVETVMALSGEAFLDFAVRSGVLRFGTCQVYRGRSGGLTATARMHGLSPDLGDEVWTPADATVCEADWYLRDLNDPIEPPPTPLPIWTASAHLLLALAARVQAARLALGHALRRHRCLLDRSPADLHALADRYRQQHRQETDRQPA